MLAGRSIGDLAQEIERRANAKRDYVANTKQVSFVASDDSKSVRLAIENTGEFDLTDHTHRQIGTHTEIPAKYYDRMRSNSADLLIHNVNHWLANNPTQRMVRTLDGNARAFLSNRYRIIDNDQVAAAALPVLLEAGDIQVVSSEITERRLYIKALFPKIEGEVAKGDVVQSGVVISNSEVGLGGVRVEPLLYRLVCLNGLIASSFGQRKNHIGRAFANSDEAYQLYSDETLQKDDEAMLLKIRDTVKAAADEAGFKRILDNAREAAELRIEGKIDEVVELTSKKFSLSEFEASNVLKRLIEGGSTSKWGLVNAVTATAHMDIEDYDRSVELERAGGAILDLNQSEWRQLQAA